MIAKRLKHSHERIVYPVGMGDMPIELAKMAKTDELGNIIGYYSINELSQLLGSLLVPMPFNQAGSLMWIRWSFDKRVSLEGATDEQATRDLLLSNGLTDMLVGKEATDIVIGDLVGDEFGIFGTYEFEQVPYEVIDDSLL